MHLGLTDCFVSSTGCDFDENAQFGFDSGGKWSGAKFWRAVDNDRLDSVSILARRELHVDEESEVVFSCVVSRCCADEEGTELIYGYELSTVAGSDGWDRRVVSVHGEGLSGLLR